ncbi:MAG: GntR family transcriptional regulator, partial [Actinobacteria bacterium]|nr:GntR family transcriptional regulator [Actinomycetota bacterium]
MGWAELRDEFQGFEPSATQYVETVVRAAIVRGVAVGGESIRQEHVAMRLDVSRTPIREAFQRLERQGLLRLVPNRGAVVVETSADHAEQIFLMRSVLEPLALDRVFDQLSNRDLGEAEDFIVESERSTDLQRVAELNWDFHSTLYKPASQQLVVATLETLHLT